MDAEYTISQLARAADVPTSTLRYYERVGLLRAENRSQANYRLYRDESLVRVRFIRAAQATGFTLDDIANLLGFREGSSAACREVQVLIESRLADFEQRLADLHHLRNVLKSTLAECRQSEKNRRCQAIEKLDLASTSAPQKTARR